MIQIATRQYFTNLSLPRRARVAESRDHERVPRSEDLVVEVRPRPLQPRPQQHLPALFQVLVELGVTGNSKVGPDLVPVSSDGSQHVRALQLAMGILGSCVAVWKIENAQGI